MSQARVHSPVDEIDYLRLEETASSKRELVGGEIDALAGASERHNRIALNIAFDAERLWAKVCFRDTQDAWFEQELSAEDQIDVTCGDTRLTLTLDDFFEDTGLLIV